MLKMLNLFKYGLTALMMAFAMTLCYSCSSDDDEETNQEVNPPSNGESEISGTINGHDYVVLAGYKWATENVGQVNGVEAKTGPGANNNEWGCYLYTQDNAKKAAESWGGTWKLPTENQWKALLNENYCTWTWTKGYSYGGKTMNGYIVSDKDDASKFIFLPAAGIYIYGHSGVYDQGNDGYYWSADNGRCLLFNDGNRRMYGSSPDNGLAVRPVAN